MKIPKTWSDLTIAQFQRLTSVQHGVFDFAVEQEIAVLSVLTELTTEQLESMPKIRLVEMARATDFIKHPISDKLNKRFKIGSRVFDVLLKAEEITAEQFIILNKYTENDDTTTDNLHYILAVLTNERAGIWGRKKPFDFDFENKALLFQEFLSIDKAFAPSVFFCEVYKSWLGVGETYLLQRAKELEKMAKMELKELGKK